jgi:hypothetical protein
MHRQQQGHMSRGALHECVRTVQAVMQSMGHHVVASGFTKLTGRVTALVIHPVGEATVVAFEALGRYGDAYLGNWVVGCLWKQGRMTD